MFFFVTQEKYDAAQKASHISIVSPRWILESVEQKKRLSESLFPPTTAIASAPPIPDPTVSLGQHANNTQPSPDFSQTPITGIDDSINIQPFTLNHPVKRGHLTGILAGCTFYMCEDLQPPVLCDWAILKDFVVTQGAGKSKASRLLPHVRSAIF